jgi:hypothetical protein
MKPKLNLDNLNQEQFDYVLNLLIMYKNLFPNEEVYLNEASVMKSMNIVSKVNKEYKN